jgi:hypothetical protein
MKQYFAIVTVVVSLFSAQSARAGNVDLILGKFTLKGNSATQLLTAKNHGPPIFDLVVECGFLHGSDLVTTERNFALNIETDQTAYLTVTAENAAGADHADCRVFAAIPKRQMH